jgi:hypothetical protein
LLHLLFVAIVVVIFKSPNYKRQNNRIYFFVLSHIALLFEVFRVYIQFMAFFSGAADAITATPKIKVVV